MKPPIQGQIEFTVTQWASALGMAHDTIVKRLRKAGIDHEAGEVLPAIDVFRALTSDKDEAIARKANADAESKERENRVAEGLLLDAASIEKKLWSDLLEPLKRELEQLPNTYSALCNPQEPQASKKVLEQFVEKLKASLKSPNA